METKLKSEVASVRKPTHPIDPLFLNRWSPRAMTGESISDEQLFSLFEAARWAPSSYNAQPWRFLYAKRNTPEWDLFYDLLIDFNKAWTKNAAVLLLMISRKQFEKNEKPAPTHSFDTGAAWMSLALQGNLQGLVVHGMEGFDYERARTTLRIPDAFQVEAMAAIGIRASKEVLPPEIQKMEKPSPRRPLNEIIIQGPFLS